MWQYEKKLQYPIKIVRSNPALAKVIMTQLGGPDGELGASMRYLSQRYSVPYGEIKGLLTDIGTEEGEIAIPHMDKPPSGLLLHTVHSYMELSRYGQKNQSDSDEATNQKEGTTQKAVRVFI